MELNVGQNLFETLQDVTGFTPLQSDMQAIISAIQEDNRRIDAKKTYQVELTTKQPITEGEDFWMYRGFCDKAKALDIAETLSTFFPYCKYPTEVLVKEYDIDDEEICRNERVIARYKLENEEGIEVGL